MDAEKTESRNLIDYYHYWTTEAVKADLDQKRHNFSVLACNINGDFNIGSIIRCSNAFLAKEVLIYGKKKYDRRGTVGTHIYSNLKHVKTVEDLSSIKMRLIGIDNVPGAKPIETFNWPDDHFCMCFGEEQVGLDKSLMDLCSDVVYISQYGSVRSLNVGVASGIAMYDYVNKMKGKHHA